jgi:hypothetical protein
MSAKTVSISRPAEGQATLIPDEFGLEEKRSRRAYLIRRDARSKRLVCFHEAAHCAVADYYAVCWHALVERNEQKRNAWTGRMRFMGLHPTPFPKAVIGWAGMIVDFLLGWPLDEWPVVSRKVFQEVEIPGVKRFQKHWLKLLQAAIACQEARGQGAGVWGYGDLLSIIGTRQTWRALNTSWKIVVSRRSEIAGLAETLMIDEKVSKLPKGWIRPAR